jgi:hypothetical protein
MDIPYAFIPPALVMVEMNVVAAPSTRVVKMRTPVKGSSPSVQGSVEYHGQMESVWQLYCLRFAVSL